MDPNILVLCFNSPRQVSGVKDTLCGHLKKHQSLGASKRFIEKHTNYFISCLVGYWLHLKIGVQIEKLIC